MPHEVLERLLEGGQVEIPVVDEAKLGCGAGELAHGVQELLGVKLVAEVALVGVGLLRFAAANGTAADDLAAVEELASLGVEELAGAHLVQIPAVMEATDELRRQPLVEALRRLEPGACEEVERDVVLVEGVLLRVVIGRDIIDDGALEAILLDLLAIPLHGFWP